MGAGMGLAGAPATESIMGALPPERANIGSAVNDTTRELGGALGVADRRQHHVLAVRVAAAGRRAGLAAVAAPSRPDAFADAMARASLVVAVVAPLGAVIAWRYLPAAPGGQVPAGAAQPANRSA